MSNILSIAILALAFSLLSPTTDSLSNIKKVYGYGAGLSVENISVLKGYAIADNTYTNGFKFKMRITVDSGIEDQLRVRFDDWAKLGGLGSIATDGNMQVSTDPLAPALSANTTYGSPLTLGADLDPALPGRQQDVYVWLKVPATTIPGGYSTTYGIKSSNY